MPRPQDDIEFLKAQVAALTARVYQLEQQARGLDHGEFPVAQPPSVEASEPETTPPVPQQRPPAPQPSASAPHPHAYRPPSVPQLAQTSRQDNDLEKKIGQYWLNRIGIDRKSV